MTGDGVGGSLDSWIGVGEVGTLCTSSISTASSTVGEGDRIFEIMGPITGPLGIGRTESSGERRGSQYSVGDFAGSLTGDDDLGGGVGERGIGDVETFRNTGGDALRKGSEGGGRGEDEILRGGGSFVSKFAMGIVGPVPTLWRMSETRGSAGERCGFCGT